LLLLFLARKGYLLTKIGDFSSKIFISLYLWIIYRIYMSFRRFKKENNNKRQRINILLNFCTNYSFCVGNSNCFKTKGKRNWNFSSSLANTRRVSKIDTLSLTWNLLFKCALLIAHFIILFLASQALCGATQVVKKQEILNILIWIILSLRAKITRGLYN